MLAGTKFKSLKIQKKINLNNQMIIFAIFQFNLAYVNTTNFFIVNNGLNEGYQD